MKNKMILWTAGMISLVVVLMIIIVSLEPPKEGITRSQAFKAAALLTASREECEAHQKACGPFAFLRKGAGKLVCEIYGLPLRRGLPDRGA